MQEPNSTFQVYNASAGSGKTFTLVKEYLKIILQSDDVFAFQKILAVTFTNKAASEMKSRLLEKLEAYSKGEVEGDYMYTDILESTKLSKEKIQSLSTRIHDEILKNYTAFSITTIDSFTHKIIKNFSYDLGLSINFDVEMDPTELLSEAVDVLISKIGKDKKLTNVLIEFSLDKIDDDRSWDISRELNEFSKLLLNEDNALHFKSLANKKLSDFSTLKKVISKDMLEVEKEFEIIANKALEIIRNCGEGIKPIIPNHFKKFKNIRGTNVESINFEGNVNKVFTGNLKMYASKADYSAKGAMDSIFDDLKEAYLKSKMLYEEKIGVYTLNKLTMKSIVPLALLNNINSELNSLKEDNNIRLNAEFNQLISENIKDQPAPFIYERIGQRYSHYFIDEMQDTSVLQWSNLIPLIGNALAQENNDLMLVGDGKQAIYRWRGGKAEQFISLGSQGNEDNPFQAEKEVKNLKTNYRSYSEIVQFTNKFFQHTSDYIHNEDYKNLYIEGNKQEENSKKGGCVSLSFVANDKKDDDNQNRYAKAVLERIRDVIKNGFSMEDICILVRKKSVGVIIAKYLTENGVGVVSSETLLLANSPKVNFIVSMFQMILQPTDKKAVFDSLYFLSDHLGLDIKYKHQFIARHINLELDGIFESLANYGILFSESMSDYSIQFLLNEFHELPLYEKIEYIVRNLKLLSSSDAYVQFFLDIVLEQQQKGADSQDLLDYWELKKDKLSISVADGKGKVRIMTVHKSKGLEFPVVIFPCELEIYFQVSPKVWLDKLPENYEGFEKLLLNFNNDMQYTNDRGAEIYKKVREELELDNLNLLYVALTRPQEQLHIISEERKSKSTSKGVYYSVFFKTFIDRYANKEEQTRLLNNLETTVFGDLKRLSEKKVEEKIQAEYLKGFISTPITDHSIQLLPSSSKHWDTERGKAIAYGNQIHEVLAQIKYADELDVVLNRYLKQGFISEKESTSIRNVIEQIVKHPFLGELYQNKNFEVYNERELLNNNRISIPDRLVFNGNKVVIIDYKTGAISNSYKEQLYDYGLILEDMNYTVEAHVLIYLNDQIEIVKF